MQEHGVEIPKWLKDAPPCPWKSKEEFEILFQDKRRELRIFLSKTIPMQITFMAERFDTLFPKILEEIAEENRGKIVEKIDLLKTRQMESTPFSII